MKKGINRRQFVGLGACASVAALSPGCVTNPRKSPTVRFGVISDTHVTDEPSAAELRRALRFFADENVDALLHCGDVTNLGYRREYAAFRRVMDSVMPNP